MVRKRQTLCALILAKNEAQRIAACLERVKWADEILVIDDMSADDTADICRKQGARVIQRQFDNFSNQGNFGLDQATAEWVLSLDADELVTPELAGKITQALEGQPQTVGYTFKRMNYFLGHRMRFGGWHHDVLHLFRRDAGKFTGKVHHTPQLTGPVGCLDADIEHYPFQSLAQFVNRQNRYTSAEALELAQSAGSCSQSQARYQIILKPWKLFWKIYVKKQGFREGSHGFIFAALFSWVHFLKWAKYWERIQAASSTG